MSNVVIIYGPIAVGKLTVAELLSKKISYKFTHNHALNDLVSDIFPRTTREYSFLVEKMRFNFLSEIAKTGANFITTHCYSHDFVNEATGLSDPQYMKDLVDILKNIGAQVHVVHLKAEANVLLERVLGESRKNHKKLTDQEIMKELVTSKDWQTSAPIEKQLIIDTTNLSADETVEKIISYFKLGNETQN